TMQRASGWGLASALLVMSMNPAQAQIHQRSGHSLEDQRRGAQVQWERLEKQFNPQEAAAMLEPGNGSLKGVMGFSERAGLRRRTVVADREWVELFPLTSYL